MFKIIYGGSNPFENIAPTPYVERVISPIHYAKKHGDMESYVLNGTITGSFCQDGNEFSGFWGRANQLVSNFSKSFQNFSIVGDVGSSTESLITNGYAIIRSVNFEESIYAGLLPFTVSLDLYRQGTFSNYGILEPKQQVSFQEGTNGNVTISKTTSAKGFNTSYSAIDNAIQFVRGLTGLNPSLTPAFMPTSGLDSAVLISLDEKINRLGGSYEVNESWLYNYLGNNLDYSIYEKTITIDSGIDGSVVSINGKIQGGQKQNFKNLRSDFSSIDFYGLADEIYAENANGSLFVKPISKQIDENSAERSIGFSYSYSDKITEDPYIIDNISISWNSENNKTCAQANIEIKSTDPCPYTRWSKVKNYSDSFSIVDWMKNRLVSLGYNQTFPNKATNFSISESEQAGTINLSAAFCDKKVIIPDYFDDLNYTVAITPAMPSFVPFQGLDSGGEFTIQKLGGLKRKTLSIQGNGQISSCATYEQAETSLLSYMNSVKDVYLTGDTDIYLTQHNIQKGSASSRNKITFVFSWNEQDDVIFPDILLNSTIA